MVPACDTPSYKKVKDKPGVYIHATVMDLKYKCHTCEGFGHGKYKCKLGRKLYITLPVKCLYRYHRTNDVKQCSIKIVLSA